VPINDNNMHTDNNINKVYEIKYPIREFGLFLIKRYKKQKRSRSCIILCIIVGIV